MSNSQHSYGNDPNGTQEGSSGQLPYGQTGTPQYPFGAPEQPQQTQQGQYQGQQYQGQQYGSAYGQPYQGQPYGQQPYGQQPNMYPQQPYQGYPPRQPYTNPNDSGSFGWAVLGFLIPLVGLILFLVWHRTKPKCAKMAGIGALVGFCLNLVLLSGMTGAGVYGGTSAIALL
ncbi:MAG: hypothetical protein UHD09_00115 [Bifidobacterium sp.]|nr:hypothetical protein [Bifidobacterium sp.]